MKLLRALFNIAFLSIFATKWGRKIIMFYGSPIMLGIGTSIMAITTSSFATSVLSMFFYFLMFKWLDFIPKQTYRELNAKTEEFERRLYEKHRKILEELESRDRLKFKNGAPTSKWNALSQDDKNKILKIQNMIHRGDTAGIRNAARASMKKKFKKHGIGVEDLPLYSNK